MNKVTKGALAAAAGAAILAGGAGTMAAWNSTVNGTGGGTISAGSLNVTQQEGTGVWKWVGGSKNNQAVDFANDKIVPGDKIAYTATYDVQLVGTNLKADLVPTLAGVGSGTLAGLLQVDTSGNDTVHVTASGPQTVSTTVTFNPDATTGQSASTVLSGASVTLTQTTS
ncbi:alternate-type signal peptide domain-containing protein [Gordonia neofelifaecis]|uniref:Alternate-type signal peptide domain-containing protein n=1 Tax=Gordonia neofelifaecis NRRL B-59395 TaxID=644548 RepID=F1YJP0_9ACTN|nr:alternate-type signal peptide domain-containing protein [Gordonia neofelifaecis]EGD54972.1 hypothetical protein SCNU_10591 [Gordonia neofelifaecis NRRL B-59395]